MRILMFSNYGFDADFPSRPEQLQARALVSRGHTVIAHEYFDQRYSGQSLRHEWLPGSIPVHRTTTLGFFCPESLLRLIGIDRPDIIHLHHLRNLLCFQTVLAASRLHIPTVITIHGLLHDGDLVLDRERPLEAPLRFNNIVTNLRQLTLRIARGAHPRRTVRNYLLHNPLLRVNHVIALSFAERDLLIRIGVDPRRISVLPNAVDLSAYKHAPPAVASRPPLVLFIGQLVPRKGYDLLAHAMPLVLRAVPAAHFVFVSHNRSGEVHLRQIALTHGVSNSLNVIGPVSESEKYRLLRNAAVVVVPSRYEGFGIPLIEAMAAGAPVVATDVIACNEIVKHEETGLLFPYGHVETLAEAIIRLLKDRDLGARLSASGRIEVFNRYRDETLAVQLEALYNQLITSNRKNQNAQHDSSMG